MNPEKMVLYDLKLLDITDQEIKDIEVNTRGQATNNNWFEYRKCRITASNFYRCCLQRSENKEIEFAHDLINAGPFKSKATDWGIQNESKALQMCEMTGMKISSCGFFVSPTYPFLGASPDGLIGSDTVVEVKCPFSRRFSAINEKTIPYLYVDKDGNLTLKKNHSYFYEIQGQLFVTGRQEAKLVVYTTVETVIISINRDEEFIKKMVDRLTTFYNNHFRIVIIDKYLYKKL